jgi:hypothetical protein
VKHPRASELRHLIVAAEAAGKLVSAVEVRWDNIGGRDVPVWVLRFGEESKAAEDVRLG